jgi:hypothetical protein
MSDRHIPSNTRSLLPCPYCGKGNTLRYGRSSEFHEYCDTPLDSDDYVAVFCDATKPNGLGGCGASAGFAATEYEAAELWNRRPAPETEGSRRGIEVSATNAQQAWYHVGQLAITDPETPVQQAVQETYRRCTQKAEATRETEADPLAKHCYVMSEPHLSGFRVVVGFSRLEDASEAHQWIVDRTKQRSQTKTNCEVQS